MHGENVTEILGWNTPLSSPGPRIAVVVAHPDDEVIGLGSRLPFLRDAFLIHVTDGSPRNLSDAHAAGFIRGEDYARARRGELLAALQLARIPPRRALRLGFVDQETSLNLDSLTRALAGLLRELSPDVVLTHAYEGGHPDHDATAFAAHHACRMLPQEGDAHPQLAEFALYHGCGGSLQTNTFLAVEPDRPLTIELSEPEREFKRELFRCFVTQARVLRGFPIARENFRLAPEYDFTQAPHEGSLYYEQFDWGMTGLRWRELAALADTTLQTGQVTCA